MSKKVLTKAEIHHVCVCVYLDGDASVNTGHVKDVWLSVGQVTLVHLYGKWSLQPSQVIPHL